MRASLLLKKDHWQEREFKKKKFKKVCIPVRIKHTKQIRNYWYMKTAKSSLRPDVAKFPILRLAP